MARQSSKVIRQEMIEFTSAHPLLENESKQKYYNRVAPLMNLSVSAFKKRMVLGRIWQTIEGKKDVEDTHRDHQNIWKENKDIATMDYIGFTPIKNEKQCIEHFNIDTEIYEPISSEANQWDVTMKSFKWVVRKTGKEWRTNTPFIEKDLIKMETEKTRTNFQFKMKFRRIEKLIIDFPKVEPFKVKTQKRGQRFLIIGCLHRPFHHKTIWDKILQYIVDNRKNINGLVLNGDILDLRSLSSHDEFIPEGIDLAMEYSDGLLAIMELKSAFGKYWKSIEKFFNYGNHEARFDRDLKAIRKYGSVLPNPHEALRLVEEGFEIQFDWRDGKVTLGNILDVYHGIYFGQNPCKAHLDKIPTRNHIFNHTHRFGNYEKAGFSAYNIGCLIDPSSVGFVYSHRFTKGDWKHGFCEAYIDSSGVDYVNPIPIINEKFFAGGKFY